MEIKYIPTELEGVVVIEPESVGDERGWFCQLWVGNEFKENVAPADFVLENESMSRYGVVRGLHYQLAPYAQGKLVRCLTGRIIDVAVDVREGSPTFGRHVAVELSEKNRRQLYIPRGFAHGFSVLSETARVCYKCDNIYMPSSEAGIRFDDPALGIDWQVPADDIVVSGKDRVQPLLVSARLFSYGENLYDPQ